MDLTLSDSERAFQAEVREWLTANVPQTRLPSMDSAEGFAAHQEWEARLAEARLSVVSWPEEYGGRESSLIEWVIFEEEYYRAGAPGRVSQNGIFLLAPIIFDHGTPEQQQRFLPTMATGEKIWAQAWSEPEAGSDLASLRSTATRVSTSSTTGESGWVLNGQKTWSSRAAYAHWGFGLFRSDPDAERHRGLTYFVFPLDAEGLTVRPIAQLDGEPGFAELFFDDVFVPDSDVLGAPGDGWRVAMSTAGNERGLSLRSPGRFCAAADRLVELYASEVSRLAGARTSTTDAAVSTLAGARTSTTDAAVSTLADARTSTTDAADRVVDAWIGAQAYRLYTWGTVTQLSGGGDIGAAGSVNKVFWSELDIALHETALDLLGPEAELADSAWMDGYLFSLSGPIYAGTNEIQRNIVAERILGLPREPRGEATGAPKREVQR
jgi:alkylation response protein AidB-like acyl-CoA dehydrogenase